MFSDSKDAKSAFCLNMNFATRHGTPNPSQAALVHLRLRLQETMEAMEAMDATEAMDAVEAIQRLLAVDRHSVHAVYFHKLSRTPSHLCPPVTK